MPCSFSMKTKVKASNSRVVPSQTNLALPETRSGRIS